MPTFKVWSQSSSHEFTEVEAEFFDIEGTMLLLYGQEGRVAAFRDWAHIEELLDAEPPE